MTRTTTPDYVSRRREAHVHEIRRSGSYRKWVARQEITRGRCVCCDTLLPQGAPRREILCMVCVWELAPCL